MSKPFIPTWLYIKQHNKTGLKYFGKHTGADPVLYEGSGTYWKRHLNKHGNDVSTIWCELFTDRELLTEYALTFSSENNIVASDDWANIIPENGLDGNVTGFVTITDATRKKLSESLRGKPKSEEHRRKIGESGLGKKMSVESKHLMSLSASKPKSDKWKESASANRKGRPAPNKGIPHSEETKRRISESNTRPMLGKTHSIETRKLMAELRKGKSPGNKGIKLTEEQKAARRTRMELKKLL